MRLFREEYLSMFGGNLVSLFQSNGRSSAQFTILSRLIAKLSQLEVVEGQLEFSHWTVKGSTIFNSNWDGVATYRIYGCR
jgi:hypothetical protein